MSYAPRTAVQHADRATGLPAVALNAPLRAAAQPRVAPHAPPAADLDAPGSHHVAAGAGPRPREQPATPPAQWRVDTMRLDTRLGGSDRPHYITVLIDERSMLIGGCHVSENPPTAGDLVRLVHGTLDQDVGRGGLA